MNTASSSVFVQILFAVLISTPLVLTESMTDSPKGEKKVENKNETVVNNATLQNQASIINATEQKLDSILRKFENYDIRKQPGLLNLWMKIKREENLNNGGNITELPLEANHNSTSKSNSLNAAKGPIEEVKVGGNSTVKAFHFLNGN